MQCALAPCDEHNVFRWYQAGWGRYTQADPVAWLGFVPPYGYANDNPLRFTDATGEQAIDQDCAERIGRELVQTLGGGDETRDAIRHCTWNCRMARECGRVTAWAAATYYELRTGWRRDGPDNGPSKKDFANNRRGRQCSNLPGKVRNHLRCGGSEWWLGYPAAAFASLCA